MKALLLSLTLAAACCLAQDAGAQDRWRVADAATRRLAPSAFPQLPRGVRQSLQARGCRIPQTFAETKPHNVVRGEFARRGQTDWAVLCSRRGVSSLLVFWGGKAKSVAELGKSADRNFLQVVGGNGEIGFSHSIAAVGREYILAHYREYGGRKPPRIDHQGIDDGYLEKASVVLYFYRGRWIELQGAD